MKIIKGLGKLLLLVFAFFCVVAIICAFNADLTEKVADFLYQEKEKETDSTGDKLTFDPVFYPYYDMLDEKGKRLYGQIYENANEMNGSFAPVTEVQADELEDIFAAVYNDHPELFFLETAYYCRYKSDGQCVEIDLSFNRTAQDLESARTEFEKSAEEIIAGAERFPDSYSREKYVYDALLDRIEYYPEAELGQSAYGALVNGQAVCAGYTRAFQYIMQKLSIPCYYCTGYTDENHAWNIVALEDGYYNVDLTFEDTQEESGSYFNKTDSDFAATHMRRDMAVDLPACNG